MRTPRQGLIALMLLCGPLVLSAESPTSAPSGSLSMKVSEYLIYGDEYRLQRKTTVDPLVIIDPKSKTGYSINWGKDRDEKDYPTFLVMVAGSTDWDLKSVRDEAALKLKELGDVCGPAGRITAMTTPSPQSLGRGGKVAMHFKMIAVRGCTEAGVYSEAVNSKKKGVDCFVDREDERFAEIVKEPCCFNWKDFDGFLNQCIADIRAYKQQRGLLPAPH
ncbi:MAG: hypothetical protein EPN60_17260 [Nevskiaceae bacterium]|nr:MAG: hypothetical protein EPO48_11095 [Nevskiaceae bacterium]TAM22261.1 MAG: hypothetical protein EPN60_17260 [Nevskiaceae bacterium]